jgi:small subunit ribosomal protein S17e
MGIKPSYIKTLGLEVLAKNRDRFSNNYDENKQALTSVAAIESKRVRNRIAGFITRKINTKRHQ